MDCDRAFMVLTRAPFPSGSPDDHDVQRHLRGCPSCRAIAQALRPAEEIEHESLSRSMRRGLPVYSAAREPALVGRAGRPHSHQTMDPPTQAPGWGNTGRPVGYGVATTEPQIAAFTVAPPRRRSVTLEALSLIGLLAAVAAGGWGFGLLVL